MPEAHGVLPSVKTVVKARLRGAAAGIELTGLTHGPFLLETTAAKNRPSLSRLEGDGGFGTAFGADGARFRTNGGAPGGTLGLALLTTLRIVFELFIEEEQLLAGCENEIASTVSALEHLVDEIHPATLAFARSTRSG